MNEERLQLVAALWTDTLANQAWNRESANLRRYVKRINREDLTPKEIHRLLSEILSNQFLHKKMSTVFRKHENQLRSAVLNLEKALGRRKEVARAMRAFYLGPQQVICGGQGSIKCELGASG
jgi:hypothetical protein